LLFIVDGDLYRENYPVLRLKGDVLIPVYLSRCILEAFYPGIEAKETPAGLSLAFRPEAEVPVKEEKKEPQYPIAFIILDPGHGGKDPGAIGKGGLKEKHITLNISKYLEAALKRKAGGTKVYMTRRDDRFIELSQRTEFANSRLKKNINGCL
jgi:N-acetylmuramoyl-L-alanine amidase